jgi:hypothetical protein
MKYLLTFLLLISLKIANSQTVYFDSVFDLNEINNTIDSLKRNNVNEILIIKTELLKICKLSDDSILIITIWPDKSGAFNFKVISSKAIYKQFKSQLSNNIFKYKYRFNTFTTKDEDVLKFVPPITSGNSIFYISCDKNGYFEQRDRLNKTPVTYVPTNSIKERYRKEWFDLIIKSLNGLNYDLKLDRDYDRYKGYN